MQIIKRPILLASILTVCAVTQIRAQSQVEIIPDVVYGHKDGMALTYGAARTTNIGQIRQAIEAGQVTYPALLLIGAAMMLVGFAYSVVAAFFTSHLPHFPPLAGARRGQPASKMLGSFRRLMKHETTSATALR